MQFRSDVWPSVCSVHPLWGAVLSFLTDMLFIGWSQEVQDAISVIYHLVSTHGADMAQPSPSAELASMVSLPSSVFRSQQQQMHSAPSTTLAFVARTMLRALQGRALVREAMASAASVVWITALTPDVSAIRVAAQLAEGLFLDKDQVETGAEIVPAAHPSAQNHSGKDADDNKHEGAVERGLREVWASSLTLELRRVSPVGRTCGVKGFTTALPLEALCAQMWLYPRGRAAKETCKAWRQLGAGS